MTNDPVPRAKRKATMIGALICGVIAFAGRILSLLYTWNKVYSHAVNLPDSFFSFAIMHAVVFVAIFCVLGGIAARIVVIRSIRKDGFGSVNDSVAKAVIIDAVWSLIAVSTNHLFGPYLLTFSIGTAAIGYIVSFVAVSPLVNIHNKTKSDKKGEQNMVDKNGKSTAASSMGIIAKLSWVAIAGGCAVAGFFIGDKIADEVIGTLVGLAVGAVVGFLVNLFLLYLAELGQNTAKTAANSGGNQPQSASAADEIQKYKEMLDNGVITQQEFEALKQNIIHK